VARLNTRLTPLALLDQLQKIELEQGRVRKEERWGPRTLDLDLLLFGDQVINHERLIVPHYGMKEREFVLLPLAEIAPALVLPCGTPLAQLVARCPAMISPSLRRVQTYRSLYEQDHHRQPAEDEAGWSKVHRHHRL